MTTVSSMSSDICHGRDTQDVGNTSEERKPAISDDWYVISLKEMAAVTQVSDRTIRHYVKLGLVTPRKIKGRFMFAPWHISEITKIHLHRRERLFQLAPQLWLDCKRHPQRRGKRAEVNGTRLL
jgi:hypothetical protein